MLILIQQISVNPTHYQNIPFLISSVLQIELQKARVTKMQRSKLTKVCTYLMNSFATQSLHLILMETSEKIK